jgi:hypothetical protein
MAATSSSLQVKVQHNIKLMTALTADHQLATSGHTTQSVESLLSPKNNYFNSPRAASAAAPHCHPHPPRHC